MISVIIYTLLFLLTAIVSGNNLAACSGSIIYGGIVSRRTGILLTIVGYSLGFLIEGGLLRYGLLALMPTQSETLVMLAMGIALAVFAIAHLLKVPESLSITFTMAIIGIGFGYGNPMNRSFVLSVIGYWILAISVAMILTIIVMRIMRKAVHRVRIWRTISVIKVLLVFVSFFTAFVLGANTLGFLYAAASNFVDPIYGIVAVILAVITGSVLLSRGELNRMGTQIIPLRYMNALVSQTTSAAMVEAGTHFHIPTSSIETFTASLYGAGLSYKVRFIPKKPMLTIVSAWILTALISFILGFAITHFIYHPL